MWSRRWFMGFAAPVVLACSSWSATAQPVRPDFREPVVLASKDGVLEVRLVARQGEARLDTVAKPVRNFMLFSYELIRGTSSDGSRSGGNLYPGPTLQAFPGERLIVHLDNELRDLTIRDFFSPQYTPDGQPVPAYPAQMKESPLNLHVHGLHVSPRGNADNVMLNIPAGMSNTYVYEIPRNMPQGAYWYHSHLHGLTTPHIYSGLVGLLAIGRTDGDLPLVTEKRIPIRNVVLQYNYVSGRGSGLAELNNPYWPQFVSTVTAPAEGALESGTYRPLLTPVNFDQAKAGETFFTIWYEGALSIGNIRGMFQFIPSNLQRFTVRNGSMQLNVPPNPALPDHLRDVQFTVNGQFQPTIRGKAGQTEIWVLANMSDIAYMNVQLTETASGRHPPIAIVGQDGVPLPQVNISTSANGTRLVIPPATRFAIAVTIPNEGELVLEMPSRGAGARTITAPGVLYTSNGTDSPPAILGDLSVLPSAVSYFDGFFAFPTQVLARAVPSSESGEATDFVEGQALGAFTSFVDLSGAKLDLRREIKIYGGFTNNLASKEDPKAFVYSFDGQAFPNTPVIQPRLGSVEEWRFLNFNNDEHPIHVHVNDFQVVEYYDPTTGERSGPMQRAVDNANLAAPTMGAGEAVVEPAVLAFRTKFENYIGLFVMHCHRLNHEDNGLMALINVIPAVSVYAVAVPGAAGKDTEVRLYDGRGDRLVAAVTPFVKYQGTVSTVLADLDGDGVLDLLVGAGKDHTPEIVAYSGKSGFAAELVRFNAFADTARGGVSVAAAQIDGTTSDNIIVGSGPGMRGEVKVYRALPSSSRGEAPPLFASFNPYGDDSSGVTVAAGFVDFGTGRESIVTAPGPGNPAQIKVFAFPLFKRVGQPAADEQPMNTATFTAFDEGYRGGVSLATGWLAGSLGGAKRIIVGQRTGEGMVGVYSGGLALDGGPAMYLHNPNDHGHGAHFREIARFRPFDGTAGTSVATTSTTEGAHLLVSGVAGGNAEASVQKFNLVKSQSRPTMLEAVPIGQVYSGPAAQPTSLGGN